MSGPEAAMAEKPTKPKLTEEDGRKALLDHVIDRALLARDRHGAVIDESAIRAMLEDREVVRYPVTIVFDAAALEPGEFAWAEQAGERPSDGFRLHVHPRYAGRADALPLLVAYHLVRVNYGEIATREEAEVFGATLLGMEVNDYYAAICRLADELVEGGGGCAAGGGR